MNKKPQDKLFAKIPQISKELEEDIRHKYEQKAFIYTEDDRLQVCIHRVIDGFVSYISIAEVEELTKELGNFKIIELEEDYLDEFGQFTEKAIKNPIDKLRLLLYWYFETYFRDNETFKDLEK